MKLRNPKNRSDLRIGAKDRVLEVGGGHNPHPRANVVVDKFVSSNYHRSGDIKVLRNQQFLQADGEALPFRDKEFDYVICCQVLEHVDNPVKFLAEQFRVAKRGFIETPSLLGEYLYARDSHRWVLHEVNDVLYLVDKNNINFSVGYNLMDLVQYYLPQHSIGFKIMERTHPNLLTVRIEWEHDFRFEVNPTDPAILQYFTGEWKAAWADTFFPKKTLLEELKDTAWACWDISRSLIKSRLLKQPIARNSIAPTARAAMESRPAPQVV